MDVKVTVKDKQALALETKVNGLIPFTRSKILNEQSNRCISKNLG